MMPSCDIYQQNRQILAQLGVTLWANRSSSIISFTPKAKRANSPEASVHQPDTAASTPAVANHQDPKPAASSAATPKNPRQIIDALLKSTSQPKADQPSAHQISTEASLGWLVDFSSASMICLGFLGVAADDAAGLGS